MNVLLFKDDCHCIVPVLPLKVSVVLFVPEHTEVVPDTDPPTEARLTATVAVVLLAEVHPPLVTTAL